MVSSAPSFFAKVNDGTIIESLLAALGKPEYASQQLLLSLKEKNKK